jgi:hypothetical protein
MNLSITIRLEMSLAAVFLLSKAFLYMQQIDWPL